MTKQPTARAGTTGEARRKHRPRPRPKWLASSQALEGIARSRCLMVLSVLSGEKPVTDVIAEAKISRGTYYQLETRALKAMLTALNPLASSSENGQPDLSAAAARIEALTAQVQRLEQEKRRSQRLLLLTRKSIRAPVTTGQRGRLPKSVLLGSMPNGKPRSTSSKAKESPSAASIPTKAGESAS